MLRTVLICHEADLLDRRAMSSWLANASELAGVLVLREPRSALLKRLRAEWRRSGLFGMLDVLAFKVYYRLRLARRDRQALQALGEQVLARFGTRDSGPLERTFASPNEAAARDFLAELRPDVVIARCKFILRPETFSIARVGTFVLHPGICPEYRNAHGCFWALARRDMERVGATLLRVDAGIDTGPVYGYYSYPFDERTESHIVIQQRAVYDNLEQIGLRLHEIANGTAVPVETKGRRSAVWGQPRLSEFLAWQRAARARKK
jgi:folate-dependent phosphoribosylglycinamide formyltransferase PurN